MYDDETQIQMHVVNSSHRPVVSRVTPLLRVHRSQCYVAGYTTGVPLYYLPETEFAYRFNPYTVFFGPQQYRVIQQYPVLIPNRASRA